MPGTVNTHPRLDTDRYDPVPLPVTGSRGDRCT
jgi:hypothetical protein